MYPHGKHSVGRLLTNKITQAHGQNRGCGILIDILWCYALICYLNFTNVCITMDIRRDFHRVHHNFCTFGAFVICMYLGNNINIFVTTIAPVSISIAYIVAVQFLAKNLLLVRHKKKSNLKNLHTCFIWKTILSFLGSIKLSPMPFPRQHIVYKYIFIQKQKQNKSKTMQ